MLRTALGADNSQAEAASRVGSIQASEIMGKSLATAILLLVCGNALAQQSSPTDVAATCTPFQPFAISDRPPLDSILAALSGLHVSNDPALTNGDYRPSAAILVSAGPDGELKVSLNKSSGNRDVDRAILAWARGIQLVPGSCGNGLIPLQLAPAA